MNENKKGQNVQVRLFVHELAHYLMNSLMRPLASCSKAFGASAGAEMAATNFSISVRISECVARRGEVKMRGEERKTKRERMCWDTKTNKKRGLEKMLA